jgi:AcrR family transcriptional regulator
MRVVKEYEVRREEILDEAQRLIYTKGYEQMTIQDILNGLQIAKGTFYHYFASKQALLEALTDRMLEGHVASVQPVVDDPHLPALEKFHRFFAGMDRFNAEQKPLILALLRVWYTDENAIVREKVRLNTFTQLGPLLASILQQGITERVFADADPMALAEVVLSLIIGMEERLGPLLLAHDSGHSTFDALLASVTTYTAAVERILNVPPGSLTLIDPRKLEDWNTLTHGGGG